MSEPYRFPMEFSSDLVGKNGGGRGEEWYWLESEGVMREEC